MPIYLYASDNLYVVPLHKKNGTLAFAIKRQGTTSTLEEFGTSDFANLVARYCDDNHNGSYDAKARKAARAYARKAIDMLGAADDVIFAGGPYPNGLPFDVKGDRDEDLR